MPIHCIHRAQVRERVGIFAVIEHGVVQKASHAACPARGGVRRRRARSPVAVDTSLCRRRRHMAHQIKNLGQVVSGSDVAGVVTTHAFL